MENDSGGVVAKYFLPTTPFISPGAKPFVVKDGKRKGIRRIRKSQKMIWTARTVWGVLDCHCALFESGGP